jgi:hypothetical protein
MDDKTKDALHNMLGIMASLNIGYVPTPGFVAEAVTPHLQGMTEAVREAIQAIEALDRVRALCVEAHESEDSRVDIEVIEGAIGSFGKQEG